MQYEVFGHLQDMGVYKLNELALWSVYACNEKWLAMDVMYVAVNFV